MAELWWPEGNAGHRKKLWKHSGGPDGFNLLGVLDCNYEACQKAADAQPVSPHGEVKISPGVGLIIRMTPTLVDIMSRCVSENHKTIWRNYAARYNAHIRSNVLPLFPVPPKEWQWFRNSAGEWWAWCPPGFVYYNGRQYQLAASDTVHCCAVSI